MSDSHPKPVRSERPREYFAHDGIAVDEEQAWSTVGIPM
jgi:hypothetical protein